MIELKPRCDGCGTSNAIDAEYCIECGIKFINSELHFGTHERDKNGKFVIPDSKSYEYGLDTKKKNSLDHLKETLSPKTPFPEDKRLDFRSNQIPDWELPLMGSGILPSQAWNKKGFRKINPPKILKQEIKKKVKDLNWKVPIYNDTPEHMEFTPLTNPPQKGGIIKMPDASPEQIRHFMEAYKGELEKASKDPNYIPLIVTNKDIEIVPFPSQDKPDIATRRGPKPNKEFKWGVSGKDASINPSSGLDRPFPSKHVRKPWGGGKCDCDGINSICDEFIERDMREGVSPRKRPYSAIIGTDVRKGIDGFSRTEKLILNFSSLAIIISLGILYFM